MVTPSYMHFQVLVSLYHEQISIVVKMQYALVQEQLYHLNPQLKVLYQIEFLIRLMS